MGTTRTIEVPLNRVEGDLEVRVETTDGVVTDAWCAGTMFRGFERIMVGRGRLDGLVITPRICGLCSVSHLTAAARALDALAAAEVPPNAVRIRNVALMVEHVQNDMRQAFLMFAPDLANQAYRDVELYDEVVRRYAPFEGETAAQVVRQTKRLIEIIALVGGQWPHTSFMVPGGITSVPTTGDLLQCQLLLEHFRSWYEERVLGCSVERWREVRSVEALDGWLDESSAHRDSDLGLFLRFARRLGLHNVGAAHEQYVSFGSLDLPGGDGQLVAAGFAVGTAVRSFEQEKISEHTAYSWFEGDEPLHPSRGSTTPYASGHEGKPYSWAKAPRYDHVPSETGPLAEMLVGRDPLFVDLVGRDGSSSMVRELARIVRPATLLPTAQQWLADVQQGEPFYSKPTLPDAGEGYGLMHASRGALGHWVRINEGRIDHYQIITPTAWNGSPRDARGRRGPMEEALVGTEVRDPDNPVELGLVVRSFDPCLVCTVHMVDRDGQRSSARRLRVGT